MPQKKNPDVAELARGKAGRLTGNLMSLLTTLKGLPFAYNKDLQEDKEPVFDSLDNLALLLPAVTGMVETLTFNTDIPRQAAPKGFSLATEIADWLVRKGVPFRSAHEIAGSCVSHCEDRGIELHEIADADLAGISEHLDPSVKQVLDVDGALAARTTPGSTGPKAAADQLAAVRERVERLRGRLE
ncbi:hypothetical protein GCM10029992_56180 [Glycomyces albus]